MAHKAEAYGGLGTAYSDFLDKLAPPDSHTQLLKSLGPERTTAEAGAAMQDDLGKALDTAKASAKADYATWREKTGDVPVDLSPVGEKWAGKFAETRDALKKMPWEYAGPVWKLLKKAASLGGPDLPETVRVGGAAVGAGPPACASERGQHGHGTTASLGLPGHGLRSLWGGP